MTPVKIDPTFGSMFIGTYLNAILYGVLIVQVLIYFQTYKKDLLWVRLFVLYLFIAETLNTGMNIGMMYEPLILKYDTLAAITFYPLMLAADPIMTVVISTPIQIFMAWRIKIISRATWLAMVISTFALISFGGGIWLAYTIATIRLFSRGQESDWPALIWLLATAITDVTITISLTISLYRRKTGFSGTDNAVNKIIRLTVQTGLITMIFAILDVVCSFAVNNASVNFVWDLALSKLYTNALVSTLNARAGWDNLVNGSAEDNILFCETLQNQSIIGTFGPRSDPPPLPQLIFLRTKSSGNGSLEGVEH